MTLRNALGEIALDESLARLERVLNRILNSVNFAKTSADIMRVNVEQTTFGANVYRANTTTQTTADSLSMYATGSWNLVDAREQQRQIARANALAVRHNRWVIT